MSADLLDWPLASADGLLLTNDECYMLLDNDIFHNDHDLLKSFPNAATKLESTLGGYCILDEGCGSLYPAPPSPLDSKPSRAQLASDLLQQLDNQCKQENIFSNWLEEKVDLPIFDGITQVPERAELPTPQPQPHPQTSFVPVTPLPVAYVQPPQPPRTEELLREFETVLQSTSVELTHLTPPQSPPGPATQLLLSYAQQAHCVPLVPANVPAAPWPLSSVPLTQPAHVPVNTPLTVECELEEVEKLVRDRAAQLASPPPSVGSSSFSPRSSPSSSPRSSSADEDWSASGNETRSRSKPYSRSLDDRRSRKKEQNKNAATRYRQKKKAEIEVLLSEERSLRQRHTELGNKCADLQREISYLKGLMRDLFKAKGLIK